jgi:hypothetical protein
LRLIEFNLPIFHRCLAVSTKWSEDGGSLRVSEMPGITSEYNPWKKREDFFRIKTGDIKSLLNFLDTVGLWDAVHLPDRSSKQAAVKLVKPQLATYEDFSYRVDYQPSVPAWWVWRRRDLLRREMIENTLTFPDFPLRIESVNKNPQLVVTTMTFWEAIFFSLTVDVVRGGKFQKCKRPDCDVSFVKTTRHRKIFHAWECGHIEAERRRRRRALSVKPAK